MERLIGSIRRECLDHATILSAWHLRRTLTAYFEYYHQARTRRTLERPDQEKVVELPMVNGLHHRYTSQAA
jgi:putative transposase